MGFYIITMVVRDGVPKSQSLFTTPSYDNNVLHGDDGNSNHNNNILYDNSRNYY